MVGEVAVSVVSVVVAGVVLASVDGVVVGVVVPSVAAPLDPWRPLMITKDGDPCRSSTTCRIGSGTLAICSARSSSDAGVAPGTVASVVAVVL